MKALIVKDMLALRGTIRYFAGIFLVFALTMMDVGFCAILLYTSMLPYTALSYDERARFEQLALTMPFTVQQLVLSKYLLGWLAMAVMLPFTILGTYVFSNLGWFSADYSALFKWAFSGMIVLSTSLPLMFKKGVEVGRLLNVLVIVVSAAASMIIIDNLKLLFGGMLLWPMMAAVAVLVSFVSVKLSTGWYAARIKN